MHASISICIHCHRHLNTFKNKSDEKKKKRERTIARAIFEHNLASLAVILTVKSAPRFLPSAIEGNTNKLNENSQCF